MDVGVESWFSFDFIFFGDMSFSFSGMSLTRDSISRMSLTRKARMGYRHLFVFAVCGLSLSNAMTCPRI